MKNYINFLNGKGGGGLYTLYSGAWGGGEGVKIAWDVNFIMLPTQ